MKTSLSGLLTLAALSLVACAGTPDKPTPEPSPEPEPHSQQQPQQVDAPPEPALCADPQACFAQGQQIMEEQQREAYPKARSAFSMACEAGLGQGCLRQGQMTFDGLGGLKDESQAFALFSRACDLGAFQGCGNVGLMYIEGLGTSRDPGRAMPYLQRGCKEDGESCFNAAVLWYKGIGVDKDVQNAWEMFKISCDRGFQEGCEQMRRITPELDLETE